MQFCGRYSMYWPVFLLLRIVPRLITGPVGFGLVFLEIFHQVFPGCSSWFFLVLSVALAES
jgi:hypothetical protein